MISGILGKKVGMTQIFVDDKCLPVTVVQAGPCTILQLKTKDKDGYNAIQLGFEDQREKLATKSEKGHAEKHANSSPKKLVREIPWDGKEDENIQPGKEITLADINKFKYVDVIGTTKGKGFQGVVRRHGFAGGPKTHGQSDRLRTPGSIGQSSDPSRVFKGMRMAGQMGNKRCTVRNAKVVAVDEEKGLISVKGGIPGPNGGYVMLRRALVD